MLNQKRLGAFVVCVSAASCSTAAHNRPTASILATGGGRDTGGDRATGGNSSGITPASGGPSAGGSGASAAKSGGATGSVGGAGMTSGGTSASGGNGAAMGGAANSTGMGGAQAFGNAPSCAGLPATCGMNGNSDCCGSNLVTGGTFQPVEEDSGSSATVGDFHLDNFEVTVGRFRKFLAAYSQNMIPAGAGKNLNNARDPGWDAAWNTNLPSDSAAFKGLLACTGEAGQLTDSQTWTDAPGANENRPINCVNWFEAEAFCTWDGGRIPTEAEWTYAAAGGSDQRVYPWGPTDPGMNANLAVWGCYFNGTGSCSGVENIGVVGSIPAGNGKWGQSDLAGNVWEWTQDWFVDGFPSPCVNCALLTAPAGGEAPNRTLRSASFNTPASDLYRLKSTNHRNEELPDQRFPYYGLRCARNP